MTDKTDEEIIEELKEGHSDGYFQPDEDTLNRMLEEILGDVEVWTESEGGPNGPWWYKSLTVKRRDNQIRVYDVDGELAGTIAVKALKNGDDAHDDLKERLEMANEQTLQRL